MLLRSIGCVALFQSNIRVMLQRATTRPMRVGCPCSLAPSMSTSAARGEGKRQEHDKYGGSDQRGEGGATESRTTRSLSRRKKGVG